MAKYSDVFFDLDRTLWDFETNSRKALSQIYIDFKLAEHGLILENFVEEYQRINESYWKFYRMGSISKRDLRRLRFTKTLEHFGIRDGVLGEKLDRAYLEVSPYQTVLLPETKSTLDYLAGKYKLHIITNGFEEVQHIKLSKSGIQPYFDIIVTSEKAMARKPDSLVFNLAMQLANTRAMDSIMVGDDLQADIEGARRVFMDQVYFNPNGLEHDDNPTFEIKELSELKLII